MSKDKKDIINDLLDGNNKPEATVDGNRVIVNNRIKQLKSLNKAKSSPRVAIDNDEESNPLGFKAHANQYNDTAESKGSGNKDYNKSKYLEHKPAKANKPMSPEAKAKSDKYRAESKAIREHNKKTNSGIKMNKSELLDKLEALIKAKVDEGHSTEVKVKDRSERNDRLTGTPKNKDVGVHAGIVPKSGKSKAGIFAERASSSIDLASEANKDSAKNIHIKALSNLRSLKEKDRSGMKKSEALDIIEDLCKSVKEKKAKKLKKADTQQTPAPAPPAGIAAPAPATNPVDTAIPGMPNLYQGAGSKGSMGIRG